jgi:hypothetical protein
MSIRYLPDSPPVFARPHRVRTEETWAQAREDYAAGYSAPEVAERYGVGVSTLRERASREGWRRSDLPDPPRPSFEDEDAADQDPPAPGEDLAAVARKAAARAVRRGRLAEARGWLKLTRELRVLAGEERAKTASAAGAKAAAEVDARRLELINDIRGLADAFRTSLRAPRDLDALDALDDSDAEISESNASDLGGQDLDEDFDEDLDEEDAYSPSQ